MTTLDTSTAPVIAPTRFRRPAIAFIVAGILWIIGDLIEFPSGTFSLSDGPLFVVHQIIFFSSMILLVIGLFGIRSAGIGGKSRTVSVALVLVAASWILLMVASLVFNFLGVDVAAFGLAIGGNLRMLSELLAGISIAAVGAVNGWARFSFLIWAVFNTVSLVLQVALGGTTGDGPGFAVELIFATLMALVGVSLLRARTTNSGPTIR